MIFSVLFFSIFSVLLIFPQGKYFFILTGILALLIMLFARKNLIFSDSQPGKNNWFIYLLLLSGGIFLFFLFPVLFNSLSPLLAFEKWIMYGIGWVSFIFFLLLPENLWQKMKFFTLLKGVLLIFALLVILGYFLPSIDFFLQKSILFYRGMGHSHFAIIFILFLPLAWHDFLLQKNWLNIAFLLISYVIFFLSFGRIIQLLAFIETSLIIKSQLQRNKYVSRHLRITFGMLLMLLLMSLSIFFVGSFAPKILSCSKDITYSNPFCKLFSQEKRYQYWQYAWSGIKQKVWFGWGLASYGAYAANISYFSDMSSEYVHNDLLQTYFEIGVIGGSLVWLIFLSVMLKFGQKYNPFFLKTEQSNLMLGVIALLINAVVDFDWQLIPAFLLTTIVLARLTRAYLHSSGSMVTPILINKRSTWVKSIIVCFFVLCSISTISAVLATIAQITIFMNRPSLAFNIFPSVIESSNCQVYRHLKEKQQLEYLKLYRQDSYSLSMCMPQMEDNLQKKQFYVQLFKINQKYRLDSSYQNFLTKQIEKCFDPVNSSQCVYSQGELLEALEEIYTTILLENRYLGMRTSSIPFSVREDIAQIALKLESQFLAIHEAAAAQEAYRLYQQIKPQ